MNRRLLALMLALCLTLLCACSAPPEEGTASATLAPAAAPYAAPNDLEESWEETVALYLPSADGQRLVAQWAVIPRNHREHPARAVAEALLAFRGNEEAQSLGGSVPLTLGGERPVEVACGVCTVNLAATALQLGYQMQYTVCLSLARTLCALEDIQYVNVLIAERAIALDITGTLPCGAVTAHPGEELNALWERMDARRTPLGESPTLTPLTAPAVLYFPAEDGQGILPEVRTVTFSGQHPQQITLGLLNALSAGPRSLTGTDLAFSPGTDLILAPEISTPETGGQQITLYFSASLLSQLEAQGINPGCYLAAVVRTLTDFLPSVTSVQVITGDTGLEAVSLGQTELTLTDGLLRRRDFAGMSLTQIPVWLRRGEKLTRVLRAVPAEESGDVLTYVSALFAGPTQREQAAGLSPVWPGVLEGSDVLGLATEGDCLLLNLAGGAAEALTESGLPENTAAYSLTQTLLQALHLRRMRFFFDGKPPETLGGSLYWGGEFWLNPALLDETETVL